MSNNSTCVTASTGVPVINQTICNRPFVAYEHGIGDPKDPFSKAVIERQLKARMSGSPPSQNQSSLCGPAVFFYLLLLTDKEAYRSAVWSLWYYGTASIKSIELKPSHEIKKPTKYFDENKQEKIPGVDWMTLASLRDSFNTRMRYASPDDRTAGITYPHELIAWLKQIGFEHIKTYEMDSLRNYVELNAYFTRSNYYIISLINIELLQKDSSLIGVLPEHWVVWTSLLRHGNQAISLQTRSTDIVNLTVFSWGKKHHPIQSNLPLWRFQAYHKTAFVVRKV